MDNREYQDLLRLSDAARRSLLDRVDVAGAELADARFRASKPDHRRDARWSYREQQIALLVQHPAGGVSRYLASPRNISAGGLGFLHGGYLHAGSKCVAVLMTLDGQSVHAAGRIVTCRHVDGAVHEIGMRFDHALDLARFVRVAGHEDQAGLAVDVPLLNDAILFLDDSVAEHKLLQHQLRSTCVRLITARTPNEAKRLMKAEPIDIVLCDLNLDGYDGLDFIASIREHGFKGPVALVTSDASNPRVAAAAKKASVSVVFEKPFSAKAVLNLLSELHREVKAAAEAVKTG